MKRHYWDACTHVAQQFLNFQVAKSLKGSTVIDIGCGYGYLKEALKKLGKNLYCVGLDIDKQKLIVAKEKGYEDVVLASADHLPFRPNNATAACISVLDCFKNDEEKVYRVVDELARVFNRIIVHVYNGWTFSQTVKRFMRAGLCPSFLDGKELDPRHNGCANEGFAGFTIQLN